MEQRPNAAGTAAQRWSAPTGFVHVNHRRMGQQRAEPIELAFPMPRQLVQQRVDLRLGQPQVLKEVHQQSESAGPGFGSKRHKRLLAKDVAAKK